MRTLLLRRSTHAEREPRRRVGVRVVSALAIFFSFGVMIDQAPATAAVLPVPASTQFDITGFLQSATLDPVCVAAAGAALDTHGFTQAAHCGGTMMLNGTTIIVPAETIAILPASALTWQELFAQAPAPYAGTNQTGMALADIPKPLTTFEVQAVGNRVINANGDKFIAGLVHVSQQGLNAGSGYINFMDYTTGEMRVGGTLGSATTGARVRINDPAVGATLTGRYGRAMSPDPRFMVDQDNPTIASGTGYPMCFPRTAGVDLLCPQGNRPGGPAGPFSTSFMMSNPVGLAAGSPLDPRVQAPFEVGDYVNYAGTLVNDNPLDLTSPTYISAYEIIANVAIFTVPGTNPAYVSIEVGLMGTGGVTDPGVTEAAVRSRFEGMTTDTTRKIHLYGVAVNPDGTSTDLDLGTQMPDDVTAPTPGRWRFRPPCFPIGTTPATVGFKPLKDCVYGVNSVSPPPREVRAEIEGLQSQNPANFPAAVAPFVTPAVQTANGIFYGQYHAPIGEYIFPENVPGTPIPPNNFENMPFLAQGGYSSLTGVVAGQLNPWPGLNAPQLACVAPIANAGGPYTVGSGGAVTLAGSTTGTNPVYTWTVPAASGSLSSITVPNPVYTAPVTSTNQVVTLTMKVSNACGTSSPTATVNVNKSLPPTIAAVPDQVVVSGSAGAFPVVAADPNTPAQAGPFTFTVTQTGAPQLTGLTILGNGNFGANVHYTAPNGVVSPPKIVTLTVTATNAAGVSTAITTHVTINPFVAGVTPVAVPGGPYTVNSGASVTLTGTATGATPITFLWATPLQGSLSKLNIAGPVFTAPVVSVPTDVTLSLTVTNTVGPTGLSTNTKTTIVHVLPALHPTISPVVPISVFSGAAGTFTVIGADPNTPALLPLTFSAVETNPVAGLVLGPIVMSNAQPTSARVNFNAPITLVPIVTHITVTATNSGLNLGSVPMIVEVTVQPIPDTVIITNAEYRIGQKRMIYAATSSVIDPAVTLWPLPYLTINGDTFDPKTINAGTVPLFTNGGGGLYTLTLVNAPQPAAGTVLAVQSSLGGISPLHALDRIRQ
jgi:hypothetical protein